jgi:hypothetical protein
MYLNFLESRTLGGGIGLDATRDLGAKPEKEENSNTLHVSKGIVQSNCTELQD